MGENLLLITYNDLGVKLTGALQVYDGCEQYKAKALVVGKKYILERHIREKGLLWKRLVHFWRA